MNKLIIFLLIGLVLISGCNESITYRVEDNILCKQKCLDEELYFDYVTGTDTLFCNCKMTFVIT